ncbi:hypothetical protein Tco_0763188 [Tanacetum coccineum]
MQGSRDTRTVWNNINRVNHSNFLGNSRYPHQKKSFNPSAVLTREGLKSTARPKITQTVPSKSTAHVFYQGTARPAVLSQSTGRPYYPRLDNIRPRTSSFSPSLRSSTTRTPYRPQRPKKIMKSIWVKKASTVGSQAVLPQNVRVTGSNPEEDFSKDYAIIDSGCSGSMTGDKDKLSDFKEFKGGYVAFGNDPKGGRITGKGTIKTSCIDLEKVGLCWRSLSLSPFPVSQICEKKLIVAASLTRSVLSYLQRDVTYLGRRLDLWQCKKQTIMAISSTEAEYVAAASCCAQNPVLHSKQAYFRFYILYSAIFNEREWLINVVKYCSGYEESLEALWLCLREDMMDVQEGNHSGYLQFDDVDGVELFPKQPSCKNLVFMSYFTSSPKITSWEQFGTNQASSLVGLATQPKVSTFFNDYEWECLGHISMEHLSIPKFLGRITPLTPPMLEVITALAAEEAHSTSPHSRAASSPRDAQGTPAQSAAQDSSLQGTADSQGTAEIQGTADSQGTAEIQGTADFQVRRLKKQTISQANRFHKLNAKLKKLSKGVKPVVKHHALWVKSQNLKKRRKKQRKKQRKKVSSVKLGRNKDESNLSEENNDQDDHTAFVYEDFDATAFVTPDLERKNDETEERKSNETEEVIIEEKDTSDVKSGDTEELDLEKIQRYC